MSWLVQNPAISTNHFTDANITTRKNNANSLNNHVRLDWIEQRFMSPPTQYSLYGRRFLQVKRPNQQYQSTEGDATKEQSNNENN